MAKKLRAVHPKSAEVTITRHDLKPLIMGLCANIVSNSAENTRRIEEQERLWKYDEVECIWYRAVRVQDDPPRWRAEAISGLPPLVLTLEAFGEREESMATELRFKFAHEVMAARLVRSWDDARARAAKAKFLCAEVVR